MTAMAAAQVFEKHRSEKARRRYTALLTAAAGLERFTTDDVARRAGNTYWNAAASVLLRALRSEGHVRVVSPEGSKPYVYEWVDVNGEIVGEEGTPSATGSGAGEGVAPGQTREASSPSSPAPQTVTCPTCHGSGLVAAEAS